MRGIRGHLPSALLLLSAACASFPSSRADVAGLANEGKRNELIELLQHDDSWVREAAARNLARFDSPDVAQRLERILEDARERRWVRTASAEALAVVGQNETTPGVVTGVLLAEQTDPELRLALIETLFAKEAWRPGACQTVAALKADDDLLVAALAERRVRGQCAP